MRNQRQPSAFPEIYFSDCAKGYWIIAFFLLSTGALPIVIIFLLYFNEEHNRWIEYGRLRKEESRLLKEIWKER